MRMSALLNRWEWVVLLLPRNWKRKLRSAAGWVPW